MLPVATDVAIHVGLCVSRCLLVTIVSPTKTAEPIQVPFDMYWRSERKENKTKSLAKREN